MWSVSTYYAKVGYVFLSVLGNGIISDEVHGISAFGHAGEITLGEASYFFTVAFFPEFAFAAFT